MPLRSERGTANRGEKRKVRSKTNNVVTPKTAHGKAGGIKAKAAWFRGSWDGLRARLHHGVLPLFLQRRSTPRCGFPVAACPGKDFLPVEFDRDAPESVAELRQYSSASMIVITRKDRELARWLIRLSTGAGPLANRVQSSSIGSSVQ